MGVESRWKPGRPNGQVPIPVRRHSGRRTARPGPSNPRRPSNLTSLRPTEADLPLCNLGSVASGAMPLRTDGAIRPPGQCGAELDQPGQTRGRMGIVLRPALAGRGFLVPCQWAAASLSQPSRPRPQAGVLSAPGRVGHGRSLGLKWAAGGGLAPASRRRWPSDHAAGPAAGLGGPSPRQRIADPRMASGPWKTNPPIWEGGALTDVQAALETRRV